MPRIFFTALLGEHCVSSVVGCLGWVIPYLPCVVPSPSSLPSSPASSSFAFAMSVWLVSGQPLLFVSFVCHLRGERKGFFRHRGPGSTRADPTLPNVTSRPSTLGVASSFAFMAKLFRGSHLHGLLLSYVHFFSLNIFPLVLVPYCVKKITCEPKKRWGRMASKISCTLP